MNPTSRAILQTVMTTDGSLTPGERDFVQRLISGEALALASTPSAADERLLVTKKRAAELLSVNRVTIWQMTRDCLLHPVEILPGMWRYPSTRLRDLRNAERLPQSVLLGSESSPRSLRRPKIVLSFGAATLRIISFARKSPQSRDDGVSLLSRLCFGVPSIQQCSDHHISKSMCGGLSVSTRSPSARRLRCKPKEMSTECPRSWRR